MSSFFGLAENNGKLEASYTYRSGRREWFVATPIKFQKDVSGNGNHSYVVQYEDNAQEEIHFQSGRLAPLGTHTPYESGDRLPQQQEYQPQNTQKGKKKNKNKKNKKKKTNFLDNFLPSSWSNNERQYAPAQPQQQRQQTVYVSKQALMKKTVKIEAFKEQISNIFLTLSNFLMILRASENRANPDSNSNANQSSVQVQDSQPQVVFINEVIVQLLNLFGSSCNDHKKTEDTREILIAGSAHFEDLKAQLIAKDNETADENGGGRSDYEILEKFVNYMSVALATNHQLDIMPLLAETADTQLQDFTTENVSKMMSNFMGARHVHQKKEQQWKQNAQQLHKQQTQTIAKHKKTYERNRRNVKKHQQPSNHEMFEASGVSPQFGASRDFIAEENVLNELCGADNNNNNNNNSNNIDIDINDNTNNNNDNNVLMDSCHSSSNGYCHEHEHEHEHAHNHAAVANDSCVSCHQQHAQPPNLYGIVDNDVEVDNNGNDDNEDDNEVSGEGAFDEYSATDPEIDAEEDAYDDDNRDAQIVDDSHNAAHI